MTAAAVQGSKASAPRSAAVRAAGLPDALLVRLPASVDGVGVLLLVGLLLIGLILISAGCGPPN